MYSQNGIQTLDGNYDLSRSNLYIVYLHGRDLR